MPGVRIRQSLTPYGTVHRAARLWDAVQSLCWPAVAALGTRLGWARDAAQPFGLYERAAGFAGPTKGLYKRAAGFAGSTKSLYKRAAGFVGSTKGLYIRGLQKGSRLCRHAAAAVFVCTPEAR